MRQLESNVLLDYELPSPANADKPAPIEIDASIIESITRIESDATLPKL
jgi:hypothetical protein